METTTRRTLLTTGAALAALGGLTSLFAHPLAARASSDDRDGREHGRRHERRHGRRHDGRDDRRNDRQDD